MIKIKNKLSLLLMFLFLFVTSTLNFLPVQVNALTNISDIENINYAAVLNDFGEIANYIHKYHKLPGNYITKKQAEALGWEPGQALSDYVPDKSMGGDIFADSEHALPAADGRIWHECDINYNGGHRGADRLVYSTDGLIYGTSDHYNTFIRYY